LVARGEAPLAEAIKAEMQEGLTLDFKSPGVGQQAPVFNAQGKLTKEGRAALAKALSAFIAAIGAVMVASAVWRYRRHDMPARRRAVHQRRSPAMSNSSQSRRSEPLSLSRLPSEWSDRRALLRARFMAA